MATLNVDYRNAEMAIYVPLSEGDKTDLRFERSCDMFLVDSHRSLLISSVIYMVTSSRQRSRRTSRYCRLEGEMTMLLLSALVQQMTPSQIITPGLLRKPTDRSDTFKFEQILEFCLFRHPSWNTTEHLGAENPAKVTMAVKSPEP